MSTHTNFDHLLNANSNEYPLSASINLIGEGANFVLLRLLALQQYLGKFEMSTFYINGDLCRNIYVSIPKKKNLYDLLEILGMHRN